MWKLFACLKRGYCVKIKKDRKKGLLCGSFLIYNEVMYIEFIESGFWAILENSVDLIVPIIAFMLVFSVIKGLLFNER